MGNAEQVKARHEQKKAKKAKPAEQPAKKIKGPINTKHLRIIGLVLSWITLGIFIIDYYLNPDPSHTIITAVFVSCLWVYCILIVLASVLIDEIRALSLPGIVGKKAQCPIPNQGRDNSGRFQKVRK